MSALRQPEASATAVQRLAGFVSDLSFQDLPEAVVENARWRLLDMIGVIIAGSRLEAASPIARVAAQMGGVEEATTLPWGRRLPAALAGFVNAAVGHGPDYDDTHSGAAVHISNLVVPAALAMAEATGSDGREVLTSMVAGAEVALTVGMAAPSHAFHRRGLHATSMVGPIGVAALAARMLGLDAARTAHAIALACSQSAGLLQGLIDGSQVKQLHPGWAVQAGITAARLAAEGVTGPAEALEGTFGFYNAFLGRDEPIDLDRALDALGRHWLYPEAVYKPYPSGAWNHASMDALAEIMATHGLSADQVEGVECVVPAECIPIVAEPRGEKLRPTSPYHMKFSLPYSVAILAVLGRAGVDDYSEEVRRDPRVAAFARRVRCTGDPALPPEGFPARVRVEVAEGRVYESDVMEQRGGPRHPATPDELLGKFRANVTPSLGAAAVDSIVQATRELAAAPDITRLIGLCTREQHQRTQARRAPSGTEV